MRLWEIIIVSVGLALDAFTVAVCRGSTQGNLKKSTALLVGIIFGAIQTIMLAAGMIIALYPMLNINNEKIISINQWFSAIILFYLGIKFFRNAFKVNKYNDRNAKIFLELEFYKNVNMIGKGLIDEYEKENMLDDLEENMSLNKNEILSMFENIDKNMFMLKRLNTYLNNTLTF